MSEPSLQGRLEPAVRHARKVKEKHVRDVKGKKGRTDIATVISGWRGEEPVVVVFMRPHRDHMLQACQLIAKGMGVDMIVTIQETYQRSEPISEEMSLGLNPDTGEEWQSGELETYFKRHGQDNGHVSEALWITAWNRAGDDASQGLCYRIAGRRVEWTQDTDVMVSTESLQSQGVVPEAMREFMAEPTGQHVLGTMMEAFGDTLDERLAVMDCATVEAMGKIIDDEQMMVMVIAEPGSPRHQVFRRLLPAHLVVDPRSMN